MKRTSVSRPRTTWLFVAIAMLALLTTAAAAKASCSTAEECCDVCGADSYRCARGPCSSNVVTKNFFFMSLPLRFASVWDVVFVFYGMVPSLVPVLLALELLLVKRTWTRVFAFLFIPTIAAINTAVLVSIFGECEGCPRPCGTCLSTKGMPSGHSANAIGMCLWVFLETLLGVGRNLPQRTKAYITLANALLFVPVPYSRVYLGDHTPLQIVIGAIVGALFAVLYFVIVRSLLGDKLDRASQWLQELRYCPIAIENDFCVERLPSRADEDVELALKSQQYVNYST